MPTFAMYRVFCSSPGDMDFERDLFTDAVGKVNEDGGIESGVMFVPLILRGLAAAQGNALPAVRQNVRDADFFIQLLGTSWGPDSAGFEELFELALECRNEASMKMREISVLLKDVEARRLKAPVVAFRQRAELLERVPLTLFRDATDFEQKLTTVLKEWREGLVPPRESRSSIL